MAQYQSFPDAAGDSRTLDKIKALRLPDLNGLSFLDVGCNEGFFCGFAKFQGASRSVGVDQSSLFVDRARRRFPDCEFLNQGWDRLPAGPFDVILLASALHYAYDQAGLLHRLMEHVRPGGVLVLELGVASAPHSAWVKVKRGIDERVFPTMRKLGEVLSPYAWKWMGPSVSQDGDPVARHVIHVSHRRPVSYLLMLPPAHGKSSIAGRLFTPAGVPLVSGDEQINLLAIGRSDAAPALTKVVREGYSPFRIDEMIRTIFDRGLGEELIRFWVGAGNGGDFALDAYVPAEWHGDVRAILAKLGYLPVSLDWDRSHLGLLPGGAAERQSEAYYLSLSRSAQSTTRRDDKALLTGYVDEVLVEGNQLVVRGWAITPDGDLPKALSVTVDGEHLAPARYERELRTDVQKHLNLPHALVGYRLRAVLPKSGSTNMFRGAVVVAGEGDCIGTLQLGRAVDARWRSPG